MSPLQRAFTVLAAATLATAVGTVAAPPSRSDTPNVWLVHSRGEGAQTCACEFQASATR